MTSSMEQAVLTAPGNSELYSPLLAALVKSRESDAREKLQKYTAMLIDNCTVKRDIWLNITDGERIDSPDECKRTFDIATKYFPDFQVISNLLDTAISLTEEEKMTSEELRGMFELSIIACGSDVFTGSEIWRKYREFEIDEHEDLVDTQAPSSELQKSKERFIRIYLRQLTLPLVGNEDTLKEFEAKLADFCVESDLSLVKPAELEKKVSAAKEMREGRLLYEMHILSDKYPTSSIQQKETFWQGYIDYEKKLNQLSRAQRLYERALIECPESVNLWLDFTEFALSTLKNWSLLSSTTQRALKLPMLKGNAYLWKLRMLSAECVSSAGSAGGTAVFGTEDVDIVLQKALGAGLANLEEFLALYLNHAECHRRKLASLFDRCSNKTNGARVNNKLNTEDEHKLAERAHTLRQSLETVVTFMHTYGTQWLAGWWRVCKHNATVENALLGEVEDFMEKNGASASATTCAGEFSTEDSAGAALLAGFSSRKSVPSKKSKPTVKPLRGSEIWESAVKLFPTSYFLWSEYVSWARSIGALEHCRRLYRKLTNLSLDVSGAEVCEDWVRFEEQYGTVADLQSALSRRFSYEKTSVLTTISEQGAEPPPAVPSAALATTESTEMEVVAELPEKASIKSKRKHSITDSTESVASVGETPSNATDVSSEEHINKKTKTNSFSSVGAAATTTVAGDRVTEKGDRVAGGEEPLKSVEAKAEEPMLSLTTVTVYNFPFAASLDTVRPMLLDKCREVSEEVRQYAQQQQRENDKPDVESVLADTAEVMDMRLILTKAGHSRGMVEIEFAELPPSNAGQSEDQLSGLLQRRKAFLQMVVDKLSGYEYNNRPLKAEVKNITPAKPTHEKVKSDPLLAQKHAGSLAAPHLTTVFVSHFAPAVTTEQLRQHFVQCGEILAAKVAVDKKTRESKCTGLVQFASEEGRQAALRLNKSDLLGNEISVTPSRFSLLPVAAAAAAAASNAVPIVPTANYAATPMASCEQQSSQSSSTTAPAPPSAPPSAPACASAPTPAPASAKKAPPASLSKISNVSFKPRNVVKQAPKAKVQL